jgi:hypothetical protein
LVGSICCVGGFRKIREYFTPGFARGYFFIGLAAAWVVALLARLTFFAIFAFDLPKAFVILTKLSKYACLI